MADIIPFRLRRVDEDSLDDIDLYTAVDAAIRDLRDITGNWGGAAALKQAEECRRMLERALEAAS